MDLLINSLINSLIDVVDRADEPGETGELDGVPQGQDNPHRLRETDL